MSDEKKKIEKTEPEEKVQETELKDKDLDNVAGGSSNLNLSKSNVN